MEEPAEAEAEEADTPRTKYTQKLERLLEETQEELTEFKRIALQTGDREKTPRSAPIPGETPADSALIIENQKLRSMMRQQEKQMKELVEERDELKECLRQEKATVVRLKKTVKGEVTHCRPC